MYFLSPTQGYKSPSWGYMSPTQKHKYLSQGQNFPLDRIYFFSPRPNESIRREPKGGRAVVQRPLRPSEKVLLKERTDTQDVRRHTTEADDQQRDEHSQRQVDGKVVLVDLEERTNARQVGQEQIVDELDVQRATTDILQAASYDRQPRAILVVIAALHEHEGAQ